MFKFIQLAATSSILMGTGVFAQDDPASMDAREAAELAAKAAAQAVEDTAKAALAADAEVAKGRVVSSPQATPVDYSMLRTRPSDYPAALWEEGPEATVDYTVSVSADGEPTACEVNETSGYDLLDELSCSILMERASFDPALDEEGNPATGKFSGTHFWRKQEPDFGGPMKVHVAYTINADGTSQDCEVIEVSGVISEQMRSTFEREPCPGINRSHQAPYRDENGNPVTRRVELSIQVDARAP